MIIVTMVLAGALGFFMGILFSAVTTVDERIAARLATKSARIDERIQTAVGTDQVS